MYIKKFEKSSFCYLNLSRDNTKWTLSHNKAGHGTSIVCQGDAGQMSLLAWFRVDSLVVLSFCVCEDVRLQVGRLSKFLVAAIKGAHIWAVSSVDAHMCAQVKVQGEPLATALKCAL